MAYKFLNFRNTLAGGTGLSSLNGGVNNGDGPDAAGYAASTDTYSTTRNGITFGRLSSAPFSSDTASPVDAHFSGSQRAFLTTGAFGFQYVTRINLTNGFYTFRTSIGGGANCGFTWWDGAAPSATKYAGNKVFGAGSHVICNGNDYVTTAGGTSDAAGIPPSHASGDATDGTVIWTFVRQSLLWVHGGATGSTVDATSVDRGGTAGWLANNAESAPAQVTQGYISGVRTSDSADNTIIHNFGWQTYVMPLQDVTLNDKLNVPISGSPTIYARQPAGVPLARIISTLGDQTFSIDPTCDLAPYVTTRTYALGEATTPGVYLMSNGTPIPDTFAGARSLKIIQSSSGTADHTTTFSVNVVSSGGRLTPNNGGILSLISTEAWMIHDKVEQIKATRWAGYTGQAIDPAKDFVANGALDFAAKWNAITPDTTSWYRIQVSDGATWDGQNITCNSKNFGTGGILVEPASGKDPAINSQITFNTARGLHMRNLKMPFVGSKMPGPFECIHFNDNFASAGYANVFIIENNRIGVMFDPAVREVDISGSNGTNETSSGDNRPFFVHFAEHAEFRGNTFDGFGQGIIGNGCRLLVVENNHVMRASNDFIPWCPMEDYDNTTNFAAFGDHNIYVSIADNTYHYEADVAGYTNGKHGDFRQVRLLKTALWSSGASITLGTKRLFGGKIFQCTTPGTTGTTGPTGNVNDTNIADGTVVWTCIAALPPLVIWESFHGNDLMSAEKVIHSGTNDRQFWFQNLDQTGYTLHAAVFDNAQAGMGQYGFAPAHSGNVYVEFNAAGPPSANDTTQAYDSNLFPQIQSQGNLAKVVARCNIISKSITPLDGVIQAFGNVICSPTTTDNGVNDPRNVFQGQFTTEIATSGVTPRITWARADGWTDSPTRTKKEVKLVLRKQLRPKAGKGAGCSVTVPFTVGPAPGNTGPNFDGSLTVTP